MKKMMLAVAALIFGAAILTAQTSEVKTATSSLIEDGAIDSLAFGTEDNDGLTFVQFNDGAGYINFGWGKWLADSFWLSIYDSWWNNNGSLSNGAYVNKSYGTKDGINIDYTDAHKWNDVGTDAWNLDNTFALGLGFGNFGTQIKWRADWYERQCAGTINGNDNIFGTADSVQTVSDENPSTPAGSKTTVKYDNIKNYKRNNYFTVNFDGAGVKDVGDSEFYFELKRIKFDWINDTKANDYSNITNVNGKDTNKVTANAAQIFNTFTPGLTFELGMNLKEGDYATTKLVLEDSFSMSFKGNKQNKTYTTVNDTLASTATTTTEYSIITGKYLSFGNTLTPKFVFDFDIDEKLQLIAQINAGIYTGYTNSKADTFKRVVTNKTLDKTTGDYITNSKTTTTGYYSNIDSNTLTVRLTPSYALGLVYQVTPGKFNLNFGVEVDRAPYNWVIATNTNPNINTVTVTETTDMLGNTSGSKTVNINNGGTESKTVTYNRNGSGTSTHLRLGGTWFFTENVKLDAYWGNSFTNLLGGTNSFGIDLCVMF
jgi:hypothetical protein